MRPERRAALSAMPAYEVDALVQRQTYLRGQYRRLVVCCGKKKAAVAVGHTILRIAHYLLSHETTYQEQELAYLDERRRARTQQRALDQLKALGYEVTLALKAPAA